MNGTEQSIGKLFRERLNIDVDDADTDLVSDGLMDSLMLIELLTHLEQEYQITIDFADLDVENFRSIRSITKFVNARLPD
jgi:acyl carrier protein